MKTAAKILMVFLALTGAYSCNKDDSPVGSIAQVGNWRVTLFQEDNNNETGHFSGYQFQFNSSGTVTAVNGGNTELGLWATGTDNSTEKFILDFGSGNPFDELNEDWHVLDKSSTLIRLQHVSGGNGGTDWLTFERI